MVLVLASFITSDKVLGSSKGEPAGGERIFNYYCAACHGVDGRGSGPNAPYLDPLPRNLSSERFLGRLTDRYLFKVIRGGGSAVGKSVLMPPWGKTLSQEGITDLVAYIRTLPQKRRTGTSSTSAASLGEKLVMNLGCLGCHRIAGKRKEKVAPDLQTVGSKMKKSWLAEFLEDPKPIRPLGYMPLSHSKMPDFHLSGGEVHALTAYLLTLGKEDSGPPVRSDKAMTRQGEKLLKGRYGCLACHSIGGEGGRIGPELFAVSRRLQSKWIIRWLQNPQDLQPDSPMPNLGLSKKEAEAIASYLKSLGGTRKGSRKKEKIVSQRPLERVVADGKRVFSDLGCGTCHATGTDQVEPMAPELTYVGDKLRADWVLAYLKRPRSVRPWIGARMPDFRFTEEQASAITNYLVTLRDENKPPLPRRLNVSGKHSEVMVNAGRLLASKKYFACVSCHPTGDRKPDGPPDDWAPDLTLASSRLNAEWIVRWLQDPQKIQPGTKMPSFFSDDRSGPEEILNGDEAKQMVALREYLLNLGQLKIWE